MRVCDICLNELTDKKTFEIVIEERDSYGVLLRKDTKRYEVCEECVNKIRDILKRSKHFED